jgi:hypothetical protein
MEKRIIELLNRKTEENKKLIEELDSIEGDKLENPFEILDRVLVFSSKDMMNFANYFKELETAGDLSENEIREHLAEWVEKTI